LLHACIKRRTNRLITMHFVIFAVAFLSAHGARAQDSSWASPDVQEKAWQARGCFNDDRGRWFREAKFGAFIHFGVYSELGGYWKDKFYDPSEQILGLGQHRLVMPLQQYQEVARQFNPTNFNAHEWVRMIKEAGQKYLIVTTKHHDGFCMYPTETTSHNVMQGTPFHRDVIRELDDECQKQGIAFCVYYSIGDWCATDVMSPKYKDYSEYMRAQLKEIFTKYDNIKMIWLDNYWLADNQWKFDESHAKELYSYIRSLSPTVLINDRCGRGSRSTDGDYSTPENLLPKSLQNRYFEAVMSDTKDDNWGWVKGATNYRKPADLIHNLIESVSKGGNFVLNVGPTAAGEFSAEHQAILKVMGRWLAVNGESIYGAMPAPECKPEPQDGFDSYASKKGKDIFVHIVSWPANNEVTVRIERSDLVNATLLDPSFAKLVYSSTVSGGITEIRITKPVNIDPYATVVKLTFDGVVARPD